MSELITDIKEIALYLDIVYFVLLFSLQSYTFYNLKFRLDPSSIVTMLSFLLCSTLFLIISVTKINTSFFDYVNVFIQAF